MLVSDFSFSLPEELIATSPKKNREEARLLHVGDNKILDKNISDIVDIIQPGDVLVCNNTAVIPARLYGKRGNVKVEITLHKQLADCKWTAFAKPARKLNIGDDFIISEKLSAIVKNKNGGEVELEFKCMPEEFFSLIEECGSMPLPPYIAKKRSPGESDKKDYQTIFAEKPGAVAAPTAGLHFTESLLQKIRDKGAIIAYVTLHVGGGTFLPIKVDDTDEHIMHSEYGEVSKETAQIINKAKNNGKRIISVGTTSLRILESSADDNGELFQFSGETDIFITPGYKFKIVDALMTNFHLPCSTLFMLVCALVSTEKMKQAYQHAIDNRYRFYSYGDACFLECDYS